MNFEEKFKNWTLDQKVEWALGKNICNLSENMRSIIVDLQAENERLKVDLEHARSYKHTMKMRNRNLQTENERLKKEIAKLKCLALHAMSYAVVSLTSNTNKFKPFRLFVKYNDAYRKAKKEQEEGK